VGSNPAGGALLGKKMMQLTMRSHIWRPLTDVYETDDSVIVRVEIAGMQDEDFTVELNGHLLSIHGFRLDNAVQFTAQERRAYHQMEIRFGEFLIEMELPVPVEAEQVEATYSNGFLCILLPKAQPRQIPLSE
jgi:HSP20 family protein